MLDQNVIMISLGVITTIILAFTSYNSKNKIARIFFWTALVGTISIIIIAGRDNIKNANVLKNVQDKATAANKIAEEERLARVEIEKRLAPRSLSSEQQQHIIDKVKKFAPQPFEFISYQDDKEVRNLVIMIARPLIAAGWKGIKPKSFLAFDLLMGVAIEYPKVELEAVATSLANALQEEGIVASAALNQKYIENTDNKD